MIVRLVRHGRAAAGWDTALDPDLDDVGRAQAAELADRLAPLDPRPALVTSPLQRCRRTIEPLASVWGSEPVVEPAVAEIPSPEGVPMSDRATWLRGAIGRRWSDLGPRYERYRDAVVERIADVRSDTVVCSHFVAINAVIGACLGDDRVVVRRLDNCSITVVEVTPSGVRLLEGGHEADTLVR